MAGKNVKKTFEAKNEIKIRSKTQERLCIFFTWK